MRKAVCFFKLEDEILAEKDIYIGSFRNADHVDIEDLDELIMSFIKAVMLLEENDSVKTDLISFIIFRYREQLEIVGLNEFTDSADFDVKIHDTPYRITWEYHADY